MIADHRDHRGLGDPPCDLAHHPIGAGDLSRITVGAELARERLRGGVGEMGIVEMDPDEEGLSTIAPPKPYVSRVTSRTEGRSSAGGAERIIETKRRALMSSTNSRQKGRSRA